MNAGRPTTTKVHWWWIGGALALTSLVVTWAAVSGAVPIPPSEVLKTVWSKVPFVGGDSSVDARTEAIVWQIRMPRIVLGLLVGSMLSVAGAAYQGVFRNPLADPYLLGAGAGAGLGATIAIVYLPDIGWWVFDPLPLAAFVGAVAGVGLAYMLGYTVRSGRTSVTLILAGVAVAAFLTAVQTFIQQRESETLREVYGWILGSLNTAGWSEVRLVGPYVVVCAGAIFIYRRLLNVLAVGDTEAASLGVNPQRSSPHHLFVPGDRSSLIHPRRGVPCLCRCDCTHGASPGGDSDWGGDRPHRCPVLCGRSEEKQGDRDMTSINVADVRVALGGVRILDDVSFDIEPGTWLGIVGPNGAGKSTLLHAIAADLSYDGSIAVDGVERSSIDARAKAATIAYVPQRPVYPPGMAVFDYVLLGRTPYMGPLGSERAQDIAAVWDALGSLGIDHFAGRDVGSLSGGETQRVSLARVVAQGTSVLVLDEATASLDVAAQHEVLELIDGMRRERSLTVVSAIHDLTAAAQFCDTIAVLNGGKIVAMGSVDAVVTESVLRAVFEPTLRVLEIDGMPVVVSLRSERKQHG
jgi:ABC-type cobalamin/Fe3+-siderophores transport system ATPase subunit/ABC-type Fe3+-siderophore transport system permease subunit